MDPQMPATTQPTDQSVNSLQSSLDEMIKSKFKLFQGLRSQEEDQLIYDKVLSQAVDEMVSYFMENLNEDDKANFLQELSKDGSDEEKQSLFQNYLSKIENSKLELGMKLNGFLDNLLYASLKAVN
jgi:hypothetical protein